MFLKARKEREREERGGTSFDALALFAFVMVIYWFSNIARYCLMKLLCNEVLLDERDWVNKSSCRRTFDGGQKHEIGL